LVSGNGSNLQALLDASRDPGYPAEVALVLSNVPGVRALERAAEAGVPARVIEHKDFSTRELFDHALGDALEAAGVELVVAAGFMRLLTPGFLARFAGRVLNIHPSLLPAFPGTHSIRQALAYGVRFTGCTVHFIDTGCDTGPIVLQAIVPVEPEETEDTLAAKMHAAEHQMLPRAVSLWARGALRLQGRRVIIDETVSPLGV
jgi:phosphoribosylglycinamide formyltransferase-1